MWIELDLYSTKIQKYVSQKYSSFCWQTKHGGLAQGDWLTSCQAFGLVQLKHCTKVAGVQSIQSWMQISAVLRKIYDQWRYDLLLHIFILFLDTLTKKSMNIYSLYTVSARQVQAGHRTISSCLGCKASKYFKVLGIETSWAMYCNMWHYVSKKIKKNIFFGKKTRTNTSNNRRNQFAHLRGHYLRQSNGSILVARISTWGSYMTWFCGSPLWNRCRGWWQYPRTFKDCWR